MSPSRQFIHKGWAIRLHIQVFLHVDRGTPSSDDRFRVDFIGERSMESATAAHVSKRVVFLPLRGLSLTLSRVNTRFSQSSSVALRGGALLNRSRNAAITWDMVCPVCCLSCTNTLATKRSSIEKLLVSVIRKTQLNSVAATNHVCTILHSCQTTILHCTACWAVLSKRILSLRCVLSGVWWLLAHPVYIYIYIY